MNVKSDDLLSIAIGSIVTDFMFLLMNYKEFVFVSDRLTHWYTDLGSSAMAMDILVILIVVSLGIKISNKYNKNPSLLKTSLYVVGLQMLHDVLFYVFFKNAPEGIYILDVFKKYAEEVGYHALWSDSLMVLSTLWIAENVSENSLFTKQIMLLGSIYIGLYALYYKKPTIA